MSSPSRRHSFFSAAISLLSHSYALATASLPITNGALSTVGASLTTTFPERRLLPQRVTKNAFVSSRQERDTPLYAVRGGTQDDVSPLQRRLPNWLTYARCAAIPLVAASFYDVGGLSHRSWFRLSPESGTALLFALASFTDWLDGYLARRWKVSTPFGAFLDPVADKLMVSTALLLLSGRYGPIVALPSAVILAREIAVSALREWMAQRGLRDVVKVGFQGKLKTAGTMVALVVLLGAEKPVDNVTLSSLMSVTTAPTLLTIGLALLYLSAFVTVTSGSVYFRAAAPVLMEKEG